MELILALLVGGCGLVIALTIGALVLLKLGVITKYALQPEHSEDGHGDYGLEESHEVGEGIQQTEGE